MQFGTISAPPSTMKTLIARTYYIGVLLLLSLPIATQAQSQERLDSISFEEQRQRVNKLIELRKEKFGRYDSSLTQKTGIFGIYKTKNDMQRSMDILKNIVVNDNEILLETKKLLQLKDYEKERYQRLAKEYDAQISADMKAITKLQLQNDELRSEIERLEGEDHNNGIQHFYLWIALAGSIGVAISLWLKLRRLKKLRFSDKPNQ